MKCVRGGNFESRGKENPGTCWLQAYHLDVPPRDNILQLGCRANMVSHNFYRLLRGVRSICLPITTVIGLTLILTHVFILYRPGRGPGLAQKMGWQSWEVISIPSNTTKTHSTAPATQPPHDHGVDWWNVTKPDDKPDLSSLPLDSWSPLLPHDTGRTF